MSKQEIVSNFPCNPQQLQNGYALSSWNYGSFHATNPRYTKNEQPIKLLKLENNSLEKNSTQRPLTAKLNKFGKRHLAEDEKIVTEDVLKAMNDNKNIRGTSKIFNRQQSNSKISRRAESQGKQTQDNNENISTLNKNYSYIGNEDNNITNSQINNSNLNRSRLSSANKERNYKFGMSFDEWNQNKNKQIQITKTLNLLKDQELKEYEKIEVKIDENYQKIK